MDPVVKRLEQDAKRRARKAARMWVEAGAMLFGNESPRPEAVIAAISLNQEAIEECSRALNTMKFLSNYTSAPRQPANDAARP